MKESIRGRTVPLLGEVARSIIALVGVVREEEPERFEGFSGPGMTQLTEVEMGQMIGFLTESVLEAQAAEQLGAGWHERTPTRKGHRNGVRLRQKLVTPFGLARNVRVPRLRDAKLQIPWLRTRLSEAPQARELSSELFARGLSTESISVVSEMLFGAQVSASTVSRFNELLQERYEAWLESPIDEDIRYLFLDAVRIRVCRGRERCIEGALVGMGITRSGERRMLGFVWGPWESTDTWMALLRHLTSRGLDPKSLDLVTVDGNPGLLRALREEWPEVPVQRCWQHKTRNILGYAKNSNVKEVMKSLRPVRAASTLRQAEKARDAFVARWQEEEPKCVEVLLKDWDMMFTFFRVPSRHWKLVQTTNRLERAFREFRRKFGNVPMMPTPASAERLVFAQVDILDRRWRGKVARDW